MIALVPTRRAIRILKACAALAGCATLAACASFLSARDIFLTNYAKELCSCRFVTDRPVDDCMAYVRHDFAEIDESIFIDTEDLASIDEENRSVTVSTILASVTATLESERLGCVVE